MLSGIRTALVSGATGFIGSNLVRRLSAEGIHSVCLVRPASPGRDKIRDLPKVELFENADCGSAVLGQKLADVKPDVVFNLASAGVDPADRDPKFLLTGNVNVVLALISALAGTRLKAFIHIGSCSEYGPAEEGRLLTEDDCLRPQSTYGAAKACSYIYGAALAAQLQMPFVTLRLFGVFGPGEAPYRLVPYLISHLKRNEPVDLTGGEQVRDLIHVDDTIEALLRAAQSSSLESGCAYNVCSGRGTKIRQVAEWVAEVMEKPKSLLRLGARPYRHDETMWMVGSNQRFTQLTGWSPRISLKAGIQGLVRAAL